MKVILDTSVILGEGQSSYRYFSELIPRLHKEPGLEVEILPSPYYQLPKNWFPEKPSYQPIQAKADWLPPGKIRSFLSRAKQKVENYRQKNTLYRNVEKSLFHSFFYTVPIDKHLPLITVAHDAIPELLPKEAGSGAHIPEHLKQKQINFQLAKRIIAVSESTKKDICNFYSISPDKVDVVYHSVSSDFLIGKKSTTLFETPYILQVGGRMHHRNFNRLAEAFSLGHFDKDFFLVCAGEAWSEEETTLLKKLGIENRVQLFKNPSNEELRSLYQQAKMLVYPSLYEGFGFPLVEAMACGTPVATSKNAGSIPEVAADAALYFDPRDPSNMAKVIEEMLNPKVAQTCIEKGFKNTERFSWDKTAKETLDCYRKVFSA